MWRWISCFVFFMSLAAVAVLGADVGQGGALEFDGIDDYVEIPAPLDISDGLTIEAWIRLDAAGGGFILSNYVAGGGYGMRVFSTGELTLMINNDSYLMTDLQGYLGEWIHVALTWNGPTDGYIRSFVNGAFMAGSYCHLIEVPSTSNVQIGSRPNGTPSFFPGAIDEVRVFDIALDAQTIQVWMNRVISPDHPAFAHLLGAWSFEDGAGQVLTGIIPGTDGRIGNSDGADSADPIWIDSGMVEAQILDWGSIKAMFAR